ncbi:putative integral membrane protein [Corynebacterium guangdongense]|uniref:Integral membrane protein n=2 Tax=Corynebacterium guangdongense TaxID=1783348 RepID=A0ABU1ZYY1_9CORY|nr:lipopolysaccharide assembly protein LapA domain-containing protein [Corynebacterium guangdongense]MDR7329593.1 putative integral membrane protein [Corynebacterium guangdongense]
MNRDSRYPDQPERDGSDSFGTESFTEGYEPNDTFADGAQMPFPGSEPAPVEQPSRDLAPHPAPVEPPVEPATEKAPKVKGSVAAGTWAALILGAILLILLLVFILQNQEQVDINLFAWSFQLPAGIAYLFSAIAGALIMALVGGLRMFELRRQVKKAAH